jgi:hypothetical protein
MLVRTDQQRRGRGDVDAGPPHSSALGSIRRYMELLIKYCGSDDEISERRISDIRVVDARTIVAFCHLRNAERTFVLDRIQSAIDVANGEVVAD